MSFISAFYLRIKDDDDDDGPNCVEHAQKASFLQEVQVGGVWYPDSGFSFSDPLNIMQNWSEFSCTHNYKH